jgi:hypothetical protein
MASPRCRRPRASIAKNPVDAEKPEVRSQKSEHLWSGIRVRFCLPTIRAAISFRAATVRERICQRSGITFDRAVAVPQWRGWGRCSLA